MKGGGAFVVPCSVGGELGLAGGPVLFEAFDACFDGFDGLEDGLLDESRREVVVCFQVVRQLVFDGVLRSLLVVVLVPAVAAGCIGRWFPEVRSCRCRP